MYSELISEAIASGGPHAAKTSAVKLMRSVKKVCLRLIEVRALLFAWHVCATVVQQPHMQICAVIVTELQ